jgi:uncharacterized membrane protein YdjX (TVP38/TMEM64 family)
MRRGHPLARLAALWLVVGASLVTLTLSGSISSSSVRGMVDGSGPWTVVAFLLLSSALTVACFPGPLLAGAAGIMFGIVGGTIVAIVAATLGATIAFLIARAVAGDAVEELGGPRVQAGAAWIGERGFLAVLYARIAPGLPYTLVNYAAGLSPVALGAFVAATTLGCAPRAFAYAALGGSLDNLDSPAAIAAVAVLVAMALGGAALAWSQRRPAPRMATAGPGETTDR